MTKNILIVDDSASLRQVVGNALKGAGYRAIEASDGDDALAKLSTQKIHLIICDLYMPHMDGITFVTEARKIAEYKLTPIIMLTNESGEDGKLAGQAAGATAWIVKPFQPVQLLLTVSKLIIS